MDRARSTAVPLLLGMALSLAACFSDPVPPLDSTGSSGSLSVDALTVAWKPGSTWPQGQCTDLTVTNGGSPLASWALVVRLNQPVETLTSSWGARVTPSGETLRLEPEQHSLAYGAKVDLQFCTEPAVWPVEILESELEPEETEPTPTAVITGSIQDEKLALVYHTEGASNGGTCLEMTVTNISSTPISGWSLALFMSGPVHWTDASACTPIAEGSRLTLYPLAGSESLSAYQGRSVVVCFDPLVYPVSMDELVQTK